MRTFAVVVLIALAAAACVKQGEVREPAAPVRHDACSDAKLAPICAPSRSTSPTQVDTNLRDRSPRSAFIG